MPLAVFTFYFVPGGPEHYGDGSIIRACNTQASALEQQETREPV